MKCVKCGAVKTPAWSVHCKGCAAAAQREKYASDPSFRLRRAMYETLRCSAAAVQRADQRVKEMST